MNISYPVHECTNRSILWLLAAALLMVSLFLALREASQPLLVKFTYPVAIPDSQAVPRAVPVPEPPHNQPPFYLRGNSTPVPPGDQLRPAPKPVPTPPVDR